MKMLELSVVTCFMGLLISLTPIEKEIPILKEVFVVTKKFRKKVNVFN